MRILGGYSVKPNRPAPQAAIVSIPVVNVQDPAASRCAIARHETPHLDVQCCRDAPVAGVPIGAEGRIGGQHGTQGRRHRRRAAIAQDVIGRPCLTASAFRSGAIKALQQNRCWSADWPDRGTAAPSQCAQTAARSVYPVNMKTEHSHFVGFPPLRQRRNEDFSRCLIGFVNTTNIYHEKRIFI